MNRRVVFASLAMLGLLLILGSLILGVRVFALGFYHTAGPSATGNAADNIDSSGNTDGIFQLQDGSDRFYHFVGSSFSPPITDNDFFGSDTSSVSVIYRTDRVGHTFSLPSGSEFSQTPDIYEAVQITIDGTVHTTASYTQAYYRILGALGLGVILLAIGFPLWQASRRKPAAATTPDPNFDPNNPQDVAAAQARAEREGKLAQQLHGDALIRAGWGLILVGGGIYLIFLFFLVPDFGGILSSVALAAPLPGIVALFQGYRLRKQSFA